MKIIAKIMHQRSCRDVVTTHIFTERRAFCLGSLTIVGLLLSIRNSGNPPRQILKFQRVFARNKVKRLRCFNIPYCWGLMAEYCARLRSSPITRCRSEYYCLSSQSIEQNVSVVLALWWKSPFKSSEYTCVESLHFRRKCIQNSSSESLGWERANTLLFGSDFGSELYNNIPRKYYSGSFTKNAPKRSENPEQRLETSVLSVAQAASRHGWGLPIPTGILLAIILPARANPASPAPALENSEAFAISICD